MTLYHSSKAAKAKSHAQITGSGAGDILDVAKYKEAKFLVLTADVPTSAATVTGSQTENFTIGAGTSDALKIKVDGAAAVDITLTAGTRTAAQVVADIEAALPGIASVSSGKVKLTSTTTGVTSSIEIVTVANNAYTALGFTVGVTPGVTGADASNTLTFGVEEGDAANLSDAADVPADRIHGTAVLNLGSQDNTVLTIGAVIESKRYMRLKWTESGDVQVNFGAVALLGEPSVMPAE